MPSSTPFGSSTFLSGLHNTSGVQSVLEVCIHRMPLSIAFHRSRAGKPNRNSDNDVSKSLKKVKRAWRRDPALEISMTGNVAAWRIRINSVDSEGEVLSLLDFPNTST